MSAPQGELSFATAPALLRSLDAAARIDLGGVTRCDSAGLALLLELTRRARTRGVTLSLGNANEQLLGLARFFGVDSLLKFE